MRDSGDGAGDDQADAGAKTFEREQEISLANNSREMLEQNEHALERLDNGTYGICESCGNPIGKLRLQACSSCDPMHAMQEEAGAPLTTAADPTPSTPAPVPDRRPAARCMPSCSGSPPRVLVHRPGSPRCGRCRALTPGRAASSCRVDDAG